MDSKSLPENIRKCMPKEDRKVLDTPTLSESDEKALWAKEKKLQEQVASLLRLKNIWYHRSRMDKKTRGPKGTPDFLFSFNARRWTHDGGLVYQAVPIAWECKVDNKPLTDDQADTQDLMIQNGWNFRTIYSLEGAKRHLDELEGEGNEQTHP